MSQTLPPPPPESPPAAPAAPTGWSEPRPAAFPGPVAAESGYLKFRNEVLAGGASEHPEGDDLAGGPRAVIGIVSILVLLALIGIASPWALVFVLGLIVCIFLHEVGHFVTARWTGMKATQFFLFMGPKLWSFRRGETEYGIRALPLGAFVRIIGMNNLDDVDPADEPRAYRNKSYPRRMLVICAGSIMHMIIAISLLFGLYATKGVLESTDRVQITNVRAGDPAAEAGLLADDIILSFAGVTPVDSDEYVALVQSQRPGDVVPVVVERNGEVLTFEVGLGANPNTGDVFGKAYMGTGSGSEYVWTDLPLGTAVTRSVTDLGNAAWQAVGGVVKVLNPVSIFEHLVGTSDDLTSRPTTVVGVSRYSGFLGDQDGLAGIVALLAGVNVFVGLINLFPMLPFDGGHAAIATYERIRSRKGQPPYRADVAKMVPVAMTMMGLLAFMFLTGLYLDIVDPIGG
jgi:membrane-associated protease RseP (regulator of RpoE activity)